MGRTSDARERLIATAQGLIRARSYASVSVDDLCRDAGVRKGSFYHFFPSKRDLALAALDAWWENTRSEIIEPAFRADVPPLERVRRVFQRVAAQQARVAGPGGKMQGCPFGNLTLEMATQDDVIRARLEATFDRFAGYFEGALAEAAATGALPAAEVRGTARALLALLYGSILLAKASNDVEVMRGVSDHALALVNARQA